MSVLIGCICIDVYGIRYACAGFNSQDSQSTIEMCVHVHVRACVRKWLYSVIMYGQGAGAEKPVRKTSNGFWKANKNVDGTPL